MNVHRSATESREELLLFVDDHDVLYRPGTIRVLRPLDRHPGNPVIPADESWEGAIGYCSVYRDPESGRYQLWYQACPGCWLCYAISDDGLRWEKPEIASDGSNKLMPISYGAGVLVDPDDRDPARRYKYAFWEHNGTCVAFSPNGIEWTRHAGAPLLGGSFGKPGQPPLHDDGGYAEGLPLRTSDVTDPSYDSARGCYMIYAKTWVDGPDGAMFHRRAVVRTDSHDFIRWSTPRLVMAPDEFDGEEATEASGVLAGGGIAGVHLHSGPAFCYNSMYFSLLQVIKGNDTGEMPVELATSRDGYQWNRRFRDRMFLDVTHRREDFDGGVIWSNATPVFLEDEIRFYYGAYSGTWGSVETLVVPPTGVGLATMPRDRFAGLRPRTEIGQITTRCVNLQGCTALTVNADAGDGEVRVEILTPEGKRVRGFTADDAVPLEGDDLRHLVQWRERRLEQLPTGEYLVRIHLRNAEVFAVLLPR